MDIGHPPQNNQIGGGREPSKPWHKQRGNFDAGETSTCAFLRCGSLQYYSVSLIIFVSFDFKRFPGSSPPPASPPSLGQISSEEESDMESLHSYHPPVKVV